MIARQRQRSDVAAGTPYPERADRKESRLDSALLSAWGRVCPVLLSRLQCRRFNLLIKRTEDKEKQLTNLTDRCLRESADDLRKRFLSASATIDEIAQAFALTREASRRHSGKRQFRVQLLGGAIMMSGGLAEMQTGEGKTLTALLPAIAAAFMRRPVHIVTVNDYL